MGKKRKGYYFDNSSKKGKTSKDVKLTVGMTGFVVSHAKDRAQSCTRETFQLLNHYADLFHGEYRSKDSLDSKTSQKKTVSLEAESDIDDMDLALTREVEALQKSVNSTETNSYRFYKVQCKCNHMLFFKVNDLKPSIFLHKMLNKLVGEKNDIFATPHILRMHPADITCKAHMNDIEKIAESYICKALDELWDELDDKEGLRKQFSIVFRQRNNNHISTQDVRSVLTEAVRNSSAGWNFDCRTTKFVVIVEILQVVCTMGVAFNYSHFKKLNIYELRSSGIPEINSPEEKMSEEDKTTAVDQKSILYSNIGTKIEDEKSATLEKLVSQSCKDVTDSDISAVQEQISNTEAQCEKNLCKSGSISTSDVKNKDGKKIEDLKIENQNNLPNEVLKVANSTNESGKWFWCNFWRLLVFVISF